MRVPLKRSTVSHHLRVLQERELIEYSEDHPNIYYRARRDEIERMLHRFIMTIRDILEGGEDFD